MTTAALPAPQAAATPRPAVVDARAARLSQAVTGLLVLAAMALGAPALLALPALHLAASLALGPRGNLVLRLFDLLLAARLGRPHPEDARPFRFANALGVAFLATSLLLHALGLATAGWVPALVVAALALLAGATGFCLGCRFYWVAAAARRALRG